MFKICAVMLLMAVGLEGETSILKLIWVGNGLTIHQSGMTPSLLEHLYILVAPIYHAMPRAQMSGVRW